VVIVIHKLVVIVIHKMAGIAPELVRFAGWIDQSAR
jgi:hypothetical protein